MSLLDKDITNSFTMGLIPDPFNLPGSSPHEKLHLLLTLIKDWEKLSEKNQVIAIKFFMKCIGHLYLDYFQYHLDEAKEYGREHQEILRTILDPIEEFYIIPMDMRLHEMASDADLVWAEAASVRTNMEAFQDMFGEYSGPWTEGLIEDYYDLMDRLKDSMSFEAGQRPKNAPESHWWWFYESKFTKEEWDEFLRMQEGEEE